MAKEKNFVSVIICGYNAEEYIAEAIESVLIQTHSDFELLLINDGSTDNTLSIMNSFIKKDKRIKVYTHANCGRSKSINKYVPLTNGEIIFILDADDIMYPTRLYDQLNFLNNSKEINAVSCLGNYINDKSEIIGKTYSDILTIEDCKKYLKKNEIAGFLHPGLTFRKEAFINVGGYNYDFWPADDIDLSNKFIEKGYWQVTYPKILVGYRIHSTSAITSKFIESRKIYEWVRHCIIARRKGEEALSKADFLKKQASKNILFKLNNMRKNYSKYFYRAAGFDYAQKKYSIFFIKLNIALLLQPSLVLRKIVAQKVK